jgi:WD40 repeat protein
VEDVRALSTRIMKRIDDMNHEKSRSAMHGKSLCERLTSISRVLATLRPVVSACWDEVNVPACMEDTRVQLLADIMSWAESPASPAVFWLNGLAGTGKSTIALTMCERLAQKGLLGASFFMSRQVEERRFAPNVLRTLAYQLARHQPAFSDAISATLQDSPELAFSESLQKLTTELLVKPAGVLAVNDGLLIVIDAMDECTEDDSGRPGGELLPLLLRGLLNLSGRVKLLLTSRVEPELVQMFDLATLGTQQTIMQLHNLDASVVRSDIRRYLSRSFSDIATRHPTLALLNWPSPEDMDILVNLADMLFVFAATVVRFVATPKQNPRARLEIMLARREARLASPYRFLDELYLQILRASIHSEEKGDQETLCETLRTVMGSIVAAQQSLPAAVHAILLETDPDDMQLMVGLLSALLLSKSDEPVRIFHPSFPDFIVSPARCNDPRFLVSLDEHHLRLSCGCLALLNRHLRYNMANLENPDIANSDVEDLQGRILKGISPEIEGIGSWLPQALFYAARYWTTHVLLSSTMDSEVLLDALSQFCDEHLFHWLELLSLIQDLAYITQSNLLAVISWTQVDQRFTGDIRVSRIRDLLRDTVRVLQTYAEPVRSHALHTFHSAYVTMPHCPLLDTFAQANMPEVRHTLVSPRAAHWGSSGPILQAGSFVRGVAFVPNRSLVVAGTAIGTLLVWSIDDFEERAQLPGHTESVMTLAISSDGSRIVSSSRDRTMRVWDGQTFEELGLCEHEDQVNFVAFSPDSSLIASGSDDCTVWIWNALSFGKVTHLAGHKDPVTCVAFFPNGTRIASASWDSTVRMWDARTYEPLPGLQCSGPVCAIAISPDNTWLALGESTSGTEGILHVFDILTLAEQAQVNVSLGLPLLCTITFSPGGNLVASGTGSGAIQVWNASNLSHITTIRGDHGQVTSIAFSSNGSQIVSGSLNGTVRVRPVASSEEQPAQIPGHDARVTQVVFSSDGSRLVTGSFDKTVRIWDGLTCEELAVLHGHEDTVRTVAYSPDGARVISGSRDGTVRVWGALDFEEIAVLKNHRCAINFVTFAPDGTLIASCSWDHTVRLWNSSTLQESARLEEGHTDTVWSVAFSPNGTRLVSTSADKTVRVWDVVNFTQVAKLEAHHQNIGRNIGSFFATFSLDGKAILTRLRDGGSSWVCDDENDSEKFLHVRDARWAEYEFVAIWTAVSYATAISTHPQHSQPMSYAGGWVHCISDSSLSTISLPAERRSSEITAVVAKGSRLVIGGSSGAMTMMSLS